MGIKIYQFLGTKLACTYPLGQSEQPAVDCEKGNTRYI
jgi:hypothetical protein